MTILALLTMDQILTELLKQSPMAAALIALAFMFLKHLDTMSSRNQEFIKEQREQASEFLRQEREQTAAFLRDVHQDNLDARTLSRQSIDRNTEEIARNRVVTSENTKTIEGLSRSIERCGINKAA